MASLIRLVAAVACAFIIVSFLGFVVDQAGESSKRQVERLADPSLTERQERARERRHGSVREFIDDVNDFLLSPFASLFDFTDPWPTRLLPTALGLLVYGGGLTLLANFLPQRRKATGDWRTAR